MLRLWKSAVGRSAGVLSIVILSVAAQQSQIARYDILRGTRGETACMLKDELANCAALQKRAVKPRLLIAGRAAPDPAPNNCTCNTIFFNIWSACLYSSGNDTFPDFTSWTNTCTSHSISLSEPSGAALTGKFGIDIPSWSEIAVPGQTYFDMQLAVKTALLSSPPKWTLLQIILPLVAAFIAALTVAVSFCLCMPKNVKRGPAPWYRRLRFRSVTKVEPVGVGSVGKEWEIEDMGDSRRPPQQKEYFSDPWIPKGAAHARIISRGSDDFSDPPFSAQHRSDQPLQRETSHHYSNRDTLKNSIVSRVRSVQEMIPLPWNRPVRVKPVAPDRGFRVDDFDRATEPPSSKRSTFGFSSTRSPSHRSGSKTSILAEELPAEELDETTKLITQQNGNAVIVISNRETFTLDDAARTSNSKSINSQIHVVSPTVTSVPTPTARWTLESKPRIMIPPIPPVPILAAPRPPIRPPRNSPRDRGADAERLMYSPPPFAPQPNRFISAIEEESSSIHSSSTVRRPFAPSSEVPSRHSPALTPARSNSTDQFYHHPWTPPGPRSQTPVGSLHRQPVRQWSGESDHPLRPPIYIHHRQQSSSSLSVPSTPNLNDDIFHDPFTPSSGHRRGLSADDTASFYLTPEPPPVRTVTKGKGDPAMLFPGSVRAAGYRGGL